MTLSCFLMQKNSGSKGEKIEWVALERNAQGNKQLMYGDFGTWK